MNHFLVYPSKILLLEFEEYHASHSTFLQRNLPNIFASPNVQTVCNIIQSNTFEKTIDSLLVSNLLIVAIQSYPELLGHEQKQNSTFDLDLDSTAEWLNSIFTMIYSLEMSLKLLVLGHRKYWCTLRHCFDGFVTIGSLIATCYGHMYFSYDGSNQYIYRSSPSVVIRYILTIRVLRLVRILVAMPPFQVIGTTLLNILPATLRIGIVLFCVMYIFAAIGMQCFGGMINRDPNTLYSHRLEGTVFAKHLYWANNFNDMVSGMNVCFNLLVINNWTDMADGILAVSKTAWSRLYFLAFYIVAVVVVNNCVVALIIDSFMEEWNHVQLRRKKPTYSSNQQCSTNANEFRQNLDLSEAIIRTHQAEFNATEITGTKTNLSGWYIAYLRTREYAHRKRKQILTQLFTQNGNEV